jgi:uncharacterized membrane protein
MARLVYAVLLGLVGAAIVHIAILLLLPVLSERDAWSRLAAVGNLFQVVPLAPAGGPATVVLADPFIEARACRFDLDAGIAHVTAGAGAPFWSVSIYDRRGYNVYSFNDRTVAGGVLDLAIVSPAQMIELRKELPDGLARSILVEMARPLGIVVVRAFRPDPTFAPIVGGFLDSIGCAIE